MRYNVVKKIIIIICVCIISLGYQVYYVSASESEQESGIVEISSGTCGENITWSFDTAGVLTIKGSGAMDAYTTLNTPPWYENCSEIKKLVIEEGITKVGQCAFMNCRNLQEVILPESLQAINTSAFNGCISLVSIEIPNSVTEVGECAFSGCKKLESIILPENIEIISVQMFYGCSSLKAIKIPNQVTIIGQQAFSRCTLLKEIEIPSEVTIIDSYAFYGCTALENIELPNELEIIDSYAFYGCTDLENVELPDTLEAIRSYAFYGCSKFSEIEIPDKVTSLSSHTFAECSNLKIVQCGEYVDWIAEDVFSGSDNVVLYLYKNSIAELCAINIGIKYEYCGICLEEQVVVADLKFTLNESGYYSVAGLTNKDTAMKCVIPSTYNGIKVTEIGPNAFNKCENLRYVQIPEGITKIGEKSFAYCSYLNNVIIPSSVSEIGKQAFWNNISMEIITFANEELNDIIEYCKKYPVSALRGTPYLYDKFELPQYHINERFLWGTRPITDETILNTYINEIIEENGWKELSDYNKILKVYDWICGNVCYRYSSATPHCSAIGALMNGVAGCAGYAETFKLIMDHLGIENQIINGECYGIYGTNAHMWNLVYCDGNFRHVDATDTLPGDYYTFYITNDRAKGIYTWDEEKYPHTYEDEIVEATCISQGYTRHKCMTCEDYYDTDFTEAKGHTVVIDPYIEATDISVGKTEGSHCSVCNEVIVEQKEIPLKEVNLSEVTVELSESDYIYDGKEKKPDIVVKYKNRQLSHETDYVVSYSNNIVAGIATVTITGKRNYIGSVSKTYTINGTPISSANVTLSETEYFYDGTEKTPRVVVKMGILILSDETSYTVSYSNNIKAGTAIVTVTGKGNYSGTVTMQFTIVNRVGLHRDNSSGVWYYYKDGVVDTSYTGLWNDGGHWVYIDKGILDTSYTGMAKNEYGWWYMKNGKLDTSYTGMAKNQYGWWYMKNGKLDTTYTGMAKNQYGWWYMKNGKLDTTYTGMAKNQYGWFYMKNGKLDTTYTGMAKNQYGWWYMKNGKLDKSYTGMAKNQYGWWYLEKGTINFSYTGLAKNAYGTWYMKNGKLNTSFSGKVTLNGKIYTIKNGKVM